MSMSSTAYQGLVAATSLAAANEIVVALNKTDALSAGNTTLLVGFYGVAPVARPAAYTQTYATATRTHANPTAVALTDSTGGTPATTFAAIVAPGANATTSLSADMAAVKNALSQTAVSITALVADMANTKQVLNQVIADLKANGLLQ